MPAGGQAQRDVQRHVALACAPVRGEQGHDAVRHPARDHETRLGRLVGHRQPVQCHRHASNVLHHDALALRVALADGLLLSFFSRSERLRDRCNLLADRSRVDGCKRGLCRHLVVLVIQGDVRRPGVKGSMQRVAGVIGLPEPILAGDLPHRRRTRGRLRRPAARGGVFAVAVPRQDVGHCVGFVEGAPVARLECQLAIARGHGQLRVAADEQLLLLTQEHHVLGHLLPPGDYVGRQLGRIIEGLAVGIVLPVRARAALAVVDRARKAVLQVGRCRTQLEEHAARLRGELDPPHTGRRLERRPSSAARPRRRRAHALAQQCFQVDPAALQAFSRRLEVVGVDAAKSVDSERHSVARCFIPDRRDVAGLPVVAHRAFRQVVQLAQLEPSGEQSASLSVGLVGLEMRRYDYAVCFVVFSGSLAWPRGFCLFGAPG